MVLTDDQTVESLAKMPYVRQRRDWVRFDQAYAQNATCCPSRATVLQGRYDTRTRVGTNLQGGRLDESETLPVWLDRAGYRTGLFGKYLNGYPFGRGLYVPPGWDEWQAVYGDRVTEQYDWQLNAGGRAVRYGSAPGDHQLTVLTDKVTEFIRSSAGQPFFAFTPTVNHSPWTATPARAGMFDTAPVPQPPSFNEPDVRDKPAYVRALAPRDVLEMETSRRASWAAAVSVDDSVRAVDRALEAAGVRDRTVLVLMSDNGLSLGEHRWVTKRCEYDVCGRVPLLVRYPGQPGRRVSSLVSNADLASTLTAIGGGTVGLPQDGRSFLPQLRDPAAPPARTALLLHWPGGDPEGLPRARLAVPAFWGVVTPRWKYVELATGERELYDRVRDPHELRNRAGERALAEQQAALARRLARLEQAAGAG